MSGAGSAADAIARLIAQGVTVATAESLTGGLVCAELTSVPGASAVVRGGVVAYAVPVKAEVLSVDRALLDRQGAVDPAVAESWRSHARPSWITTDLVIVPAWIDPPAAVDEETTVIAIDPEATFGLGDHPSTILSLRALRATIWPGCTVLDVGCGSGVIAVTAARLGAGYVAAVDWPQSSWAPIHAAICIGDAVSGSAPDSPRNCPMTRTRSSMVRSARRPARCHSAHSLTRV